MSARILNLGILAHVDAGKTTLSERLLHAAGVIDEIGRVDDGTTRTDSLALERQRGITIRAAVVSLPIRGTAVNLIDTPGHPDFVAEVDRVLGVLDGAVLVVSAVEGVQPQTRVLMRALRRLRVPTLLFLNKVDRPGADVARVTAEVERRLAVTAVPMSRVEAGEGGRTVQVGPSGMDADAVEKLATHSERLLAAYVEDESRVTPGVLRAELAAQTAQALVHPLYVGSAATGAGVDSLMDGLVDLLPAAGGEAGGSASGTVFKVERGAAGEKVAYVRMFAGTLHIRDPLPPGPDKVTAINVFHSGRWVRRPAVSAGEIGQLWGLSTHKVGDPVGRPPAGAASGHFAPPTLEAVIEPARPGDHVALRTALAQLAEQDPLIDVRTDETGRQLAVSLYGEVQKEVIQATLAADYGIEVGFRETTPLYLERPTRAGEALALLNTPDNPFRATVGLRVEPAAAGSGVDVRVAVDYRSVPLFVYRNMAEFAASMDGYVREALRRGPRGWPVTDCVVTMTRSGYSSPDGPPATRGPLSTAADFRKLTPVVVHQALAAAGTTVCEPISRVHIEAPAAALGPVLAALSALAATVEAQRSRGDEVTVEALLPAASVAVLQRELPGLTAGEGVLDSAYAGHAPLRS
ncbi:GTP-binding protein [Phytohabitans sp. LJ34]|uniref:GTP-binding protein n=1 Tax=Phytohabitans sp. LJ34 TaxID=3452217 RepID=UPI003F8915BE